MSPVTKPTRTPGTLYEVYTCARRLHHGPEACDQVPVRREPIDTAVWRYFEQVALDFDATRRSITGEVERRLVELDAQGHEVEHELVKAEAALERIEGDYLAGRITAEQWTRLETRLGSEMEAAREQKVQHDRQREAVKSGLTQFDTEAVLADQLATIRRLIAGQAQAGSRDGLEALRVALRRLFVGFELLSREKWLGSGALSGQGVAADSVLTNAGYALLPYVRAESVEWDNLDADAWERWPAVRQAALTLSDNLCARFLA
jgi:hypothetical protein